MLWECNGLLVDAVQVRDKHLQIRMKNVSIENASHLCHAIENTPYSRAHAYVWGSLLFL